MNGFETILPFLKPIEHLVLDDSISEVMVNGPRDSLSLTRFRLKLYRMYRTRPLRKSSRL